MDRMAVRTAHVDRSTDLREPMATKPDAPDSSGRTRGSDGCLATDLGLQLNAFLSAE